MPVPDHALLDKIFTSLVGLYNFWEVVIVGHLLSFKYLLNVAIARGSNDADMENGQGVAEAENGSQNIPFLQESTVQQLTSLKNTYDEQSNWDLVNDRFGKMETQITGIMNVLTRIQEKLDE